MTPKITVSIGRQFGSGGRILGGALAKRLGMRFYDSEIITEAARQSGFDERLLSEKDEKPVRSTFFSNIEHVLSGNDSVVSDGNIFKIQSQAIRKVAAESNCVIMGRCSDYILRDYPYCMSIFFWSPLEDRIKRVCERAGISDREMARQMIEKADAARAKYYNYFTGKTWGDAKSYNFCIDVSLLGLERTADFVCKLLKFKFGDLIEDKISIYNS
jgi:cytidylate kinase